MSNARNTPAEAPGDLVTAARSGDRLETLIALRDLLAERLQTANSDRDISSMSRRLMQCISEIEVLSREKKALEESGGGLDQLRKRLNLTKASISKAYTIGKITNEHEGY